jgi:hypothetical protein
MNFNEMRKETAPQKEPDNNSNLELIKSQSEKIEKLTQELSTKQSKIDELGQSILKLNEENESLLKLSKSERELNETNSSLLAKLKANEVERKRLSTIAEECQDKTKKALQRAEYAETHQKTVVQTEYKDVVRYEAKCSECDKTALSKAKKDYEAKSQTAQAKYDGMVATYGGLLVGLSLYGLLITVFTAVRSEAFVSHFKTFFIVLWNGFAYIIDKLLQLGLIVARLGDMIPQNIVAFIVHWLLLIIVVGGIGIGAVVLLFIGISKVAEFYSNNDFLDGITLAVALISLAVCVFFADWITAIQPINLILLFLIVQGIYIGIRAYVKSCKRARGYY